MQVGGDIEDIDGHACVVCPAHRYRIDMATGHKIDKDLCGNSCSSEDQKQRLYPVNTDGEFIWANFPTGPTAPLPSDYYNQVQQIQPTAADFEKSRGLAGAQQSYGLFGAAPPNGAAPSPAPLQPYAGINGWPVVAAPSSGDAMQSTNEPQLMLSQLSQQGNAVPLSPPQTAQPPSLMNFYQSSRPDPPHVARRKAATAAILNRAYRPPTADNTPMQSPEKFVPPPSSFPTAGAAPGAPASAGVVRQATLFESWARHPVAATAGVDNMDTN